MPLDNGFILYSKEDKFGSVAFLGCNQSYTLSVDNPERMCLASGEWSGERGSCVRKFVILI